MSMRAITASILLCVLWSCTTSPNNSQENLSEEINKTLASDDYWISGDTVAYYFSNSKISKDPKLKLDIGNNIVFNYEFIDNVPKRSNDMDNGFNIQFEMSPKIGVDHYEFFDLKSLNTSFSNWSSWGITDSLDKMNNSGSIKLSRIDTTIWFAQIEITNNSEEITKSFDAQFIEYLPRFELVNGDTINRTDKLGRKQGYWEEYFTWVTAKKGIYANNYFTGTETAYRLKDSIGNSITDTSKKEIAIIWKYEEGKLISKTNY